LRCYLAEHATLKSLESSCVYDTRSDELYELDQEGFDFLRKCALSEGCDSRDADASFTEYCLSEGLLTREKSIKRRPPLLKSPVPSLRYLELQVTDKCNLKCRHCYVGIPKGRELSIADLKNLLDEFEAMQGLRLMITGGEPLMHSRFSEFNELLSDYALRKILFTNGMLIDRDILRLLRVDEIQFSIDGMERGHDYLRGPGSFSRVMEAMSMASESGMTVSVATMIHNGNLSEFDEMQALFLSHGIRDWTVDAPSPAGYLNLDRTLRAPPEKAGRLLKYGFGSGMHGSAEGFGCGLHLASVLANGDICKCAFYSASPAGNIREGLAEAWSLIRPVTLKSLKCAYISCPVINECRGGCRYRASGKEDSSNCGFQDDSYGAEFDFYKCYYYGIMNSGMKPGFITENYPKKGGTDDEDQKNPD
jgi:radical SAM protein with 4Fe4S-binding SPASM domain